MATRSTRAGEGRRGGSASRRAHATRPLALPVQGDRAPSAPAPAPFLAPLQVDAKSAAILAGERSPESFRRRVGTCYPRPTAKIGGKDYWLTSDLAAAIQRLHREGTGEEALADLL